MGENDSGHWYTREGKPCYRVTGANGKRRNTTLRDARKLLLVPSVTTLTSLLDKPMLTRWLVEKTKLAALTLDRWPNESSDNFCQRIDADARQESVDAMNTGTAIHDALERYYRTEPCNEYPEVVRAVSQALQANFGNQSWVAEASFSHPLGFGGKVDLHSPKVIVDYKTKDFGPDDINKPFSYFEHILQLSAYRLGLGYPDALLVNVFVSRTHLGLIKIEIHKKEYTDAFCSLLDFWQKKTGYLSQFKRD